MTAQELNTEFVGVKDAAYRYAVSLLHNRSEAEDLVQDLYEKLWRRRLLIRQKTFVQLVMVSVRNMCLDVLRRRQKMWRDAGAGWPGAELRGASWPGEVISGEEMKWEENLSGRGDDVVLWEEGKEQEDMAKIAEKLIAQLPHREREVVHLRLVEGLDYQIIAEIVGSNESTVRMAFSRGKSKVKEQLVKIMDYGMERKESR